MRPLCRGCWEHPQRTSSKEKRTGIDREGLGKDMGLVRKDAASSGRESHEPRRELGTTEGRCCFLLQCRMLQSRALCLHLFWPCIQDRKNPSKVLQLG